MKKILFPLCLLCLATFSMGQKYVKPYLGINFNNRILKCTNAARKDSLNDADKTKTLFSGGVQFLFEKVSGREFYIGLGYMENGFKRERLDYQFLDTVHPDLGKILDLSSGAQKNAYFTYHFKYLEIPIGFNFQVTPRQRMNLFTGWFNMGINPQFLLKQKMVIDLQGFSMKGKNHFDFSNTGYDAAKFNLSLQAGGRFDYSISKTTWVTVDALFKIQLLNTAKNTSDKLRAYNLSINLGLKHEIGDWY